MKSYIINAVSSRTSHNSEASSAPVVSSHHNSGLGFLYYDFETQRMFFTQRKKEIEELIVLL